MTKGNRPGGGIGSRVVTKQPVRMGQPARGVNPKGVSQIGSSIGNHSMDSGGKPLTRSVEPVRVGVSARWARCPWATNALLMLAGADLERVASSTAAGRSNNMAALLASRQGRAAIS